MIVSLAGCLWALNGTGEYATVAFALAVSIPAWMGQEFFRRVLYTEGDITGAALNNLISYGLQLAGIFVVVSAPAHITADPANALLVLGASSFVACAWGAAQLRRVQLTQLKELGLTSLGWASLNLKSLRNCRETLRDSWRLSKWLVAQQCVAWFGASGHGLLLATLLGPATFGVYRAAYQVVNLLNPFRQAATNHLPSSAARVAATRGHGELARWNMRVTGALGIPFAVCALLITVFAAPLAELMYGTHGNLPNLPLPNLQFIVALGALAYTLNFARTPTDYTILAAGGGRAIFLRTLWLNAFVLTVGVLLIRSFGIVGVLVSEVVTALLAALLTLKVFASLAKSPRQHLRLPTPATIGSPCA
jgi:O-antigen/teichoic acid export membrane protein